VLGGGTFLVRRNGIFSEEFCGVVEENSWSELEGIDDAATVVMSSFGKASWRNVGRKELSNRLRQSPCRR
jgi:hypothetical protein